LNKGVFGIFQRTIYETHENLRHATESRFVGSATVVVSDAFLWQVSPPGGRAAAAAAMEAAPPHQHGPGEPHPAPAARRSHRHAQADLPRVRHVPGRPMEVAPPPRHALDPHQQLLHAVPHTARYYSQIRDSPGKALLLYYRNIEPKLSG